VKEASAIEAHAFLIGSSNSSCLHKELFHGHAAHVAHRYIIVECCYLFHISNPSTVTALSMISVIDPGRYQLLHVHCSWLAAAAPLLSQPGADGVDAMA
jgi:hypothetical protein